MVIISWIIILVIIIALFILLLKLTKRILLTIFLFFLILIISLVGLGFWVYSDVTDIIQNMPHRSSTVIITNNDQLLTGMIFNPQESRPTPIQDTLLSTYQVNYYNKDYALILENNFKLIILNLSTLQPYIPNEIKLNKSFSFSKEEYIKEITSEAPFSKYLSTIKNQSIDNSSIRMMAIIISLQNSTINNSPEFLLPLLLENYQEGDIIIYPETISLKLLKLVPASLVKDIINQNK